MIHIVYFGVDTDMYAPRSADMALRKALGLNDSPTIISTRSLQRTYDLETLVQAVSLVVQEVPRAKFVIAGDGDHRQYLERLAEPVKDSVRFVGAIPSHDLPGYLNAADVYVSTSLSDGGLASSTSEAMACGLPVITTDFGDNGKWVQNGINGYLIQPSDHGALAARITDLLQDAEKRSRFGAANRTVIEERNSVASQMGLMESLYESLLTKAHQDGSRT